VECEKTVSVRVRTVSKDLAKYKFDSVDVQEFMVQRKHCKSRRLYFLLWHRKVKSSTGNSFFFVHHRILPAVKREGFVNERILYVVLRGHWCNIIVLNVHATCEKKRDDSKHNFYKELEQVTHYFLSNI